MNPFNDHSPAGLRSRHPWMHFLVGFLYGVTFGMALALLLI